MEWVYNDIDFRYGYPLPVSEPIHPLTYKQLVNLRLIDRAFHDCATPLLFQSIDARFPAAYSHRSSSAEPRHWTSRLLDLSESPLASHVRTLNVGFAWSEPASDQIEEYLVEAAFVLPALVRACTKLRTLKIQCPCERTSHFRFDHDGLLYRLFLKTIEHVLRMICRDTNGVCLNTLDMELPLTYDYARLMSRLVQESPYMSRDPFSPLMRSIRHLHVAISDASGSYGRRYCQEAESDGQTKHPNQAYRDEFWNFVQSAKNLQSLCIRCAHVLDFDLLPTHSLTSLHKLELQRVRMSQEKLVRLTAQSSSFLRVIRLFCVELDSGTWESILLHLCSLPKLVDVSVDSCGYTTSGSSRAFGLGGPPAGNDPRQIESHRREDSYALGHLKRRVSEIRAAAGLPRYPEYVINPKGPA